MEPKYIFIVGLPRTGSKLMMNILNNCQERHCHIAPENFFLGRFLRPGFRHEMRKIGDMSKDANVRRLVDYMYSGKFAGTYWARLADGSFGENRKTILQRILKSNRSDKEIYSIMLQMYAEITDDIILGDRTGAHLYNVPTLLNWFPESKIVHTFRDPRAVLASEHKKLLRQLYIRIEKSKESEYKLKSIFLKLSEPFWSLIIILYITTAWLYAARLHYRYKKLYPKNYYLSKFEELISEPEDSVRKLCEFLEIEFHEAMLKPPKFDSSFAPKGDTGFDKGTLTRWRFYLKPWMQIGLVLWGKKYLREFGYIR